MASLEELAEDAEDSGAFERAYELWCELASVASDPVVLCRLGLAASKLKKWREAEDAFKRALRLDPSSSETMECMGSLFLDRDGGMEDLPIARQWLHRALQIKKTARAFTLLGAACKATGDRDAARDAFRNALEVDESYEEAHFNIALLEKDTNPQLAAASLEKAVELDPNYSDAHQQLGILLQKEGKLLEAEYHFRRCLEVDAADYWSLLYLANVLAVQGRQEPEQLAFPSMQVAFRTWRKL